MKKYNVTIIGAGPSGCITAMLCAREGLDTIIIDKKSLPRYKICGGGLTKKSIKVLENLNCFDKQLIEKSCYSVQLHLPALQEEFLVKSNQLHLATVDRASFDNSLALHAKKAGAELREKEQYIEFKHNCLGTIEILTNQNEILTDILIGADGVSSNVRKQLQLEYPQLFIQRDHLVGVSADVSMKYLNRLCNQYPHLFFGFAKGIDYGWAFPKIQTFNIGFGYKQSREGHININNIITSFTRDILGTQCNNLKVRSGLLPIFWCGGPPTVQWGNIILVGDAAGFVDEWTGEGLYYGIKSAIHAYESIKLYFNKSKSNQGLLKYTSLCSKDFYDDLLFSHFFACLFRYRPHRYRYLENPYIRNLFIPFARGDCSYRHALAKTFPRALGRKIAEICNDNFRQLLKKFSKKE